jgi:hypothetical protein
VTAGRQTGFGLLPSDDGIAFYNSQQVSSVTPIRGFQEQLESDPQGRRAAGLYYFTARTNVTGEQTAIAVVRAGGLVLFPGSLQNIAATIHSLPIEGKHLQRSIAGLLGYDQQRITQEVYKGAIERIRQGVVESSRELTAIKATEAAAERNAQLKQYLVGNDTLAYRNLAITGLRLRSRPEFVQLGGTLLWQGRRGAGRRRPAQAGAVRGDAGGGGRRRPPAVGPDEPDPRRLAERPGPGREEPPDRHPQDPRGAPRPARGSSRRRTPTSRPS